jgi:hypothetical protein
MPKPKHFDGPYSIYSRDPVETARALILQADGVKAAHDAVSRAAKELKGKPGKPGYDDTVWLLIAHAIRKREKCSDNAALLKAADSAVRGREAVESMVRRLRRKLKRKPLAVFARSQPLEAVFRSGDFAFKLRQ